MRILAAAVAVLLASCAATTGLAPTERRSGFDGARVVDIAPHGVACDPMPCTMIGAQWSGARPDRAVLTVGTTGPQFSGITRVEFAIDGERKAFTSASITRFEAGAAPGWRTSLQDFPVDLATVRAISSARRVWMRTFTLDGYVDHAIVDGATESKALHALRRFVAQIDAPA